jgi:hypothetical protein
LLELQRCSPSAQSPVVEDNLDVLDLSESREDALDLVGGDLVVQVANVDGVVGGRIALLATLELLPLGLIGLLCSSIERSNSDSLLGIGGLGLSVLLDRCEAVLGDGLSNGLGEVLGHLSDLLLLYDIVTSKSPLEGGDCPLLLCAESRCECGDGTGRREEGLGGSCADRADGGAAEKKPGELVSASVRQH